MGVRGVAACSIHYTESLALMYGSPRAVLPGLSSYNGVAVVGQLRKVSRMGVRGVVACSIHYTETHVPFCPVLAVTMGSSSRELRKHDNYRAWLMWGSSSRAVTMQHTLYREPGANVWEPRAVLPGLSSYNGVAVVGQLRKVTRMGVRGVVACSIHYTESLALMYGSPRAVLPGLSSYNGVAVVGQLRKVTRMGVRGVVACSIHYTESLALMYGSPRAVLPGLGSYNGVAVVGQLRKVTRMGVRGVVSCSIHYTESLALMYGSPRAVLPGLSSYNGVAVVGQLQWVLPGLSSYNGVAVVGQLRKVTRMGVRGVVSCSIHYTESLALMYGSPRAVLPGLSSYNGVAVVGQLRKVTRMGVRGVVACSIHYTESLALMYGSPRAVLPGLSSYNGVAVVGQLRKVTRMGVRGVVACSIHYTVSLALMYGSPRAVLPGLRGEVSNYQPRELTGRSHRPTTAHSHTRETDLHGDESMLYCLYSLHGASESINKISWEIALNIFELPNSAFTLVGATSCQDPLGIILCVILNHLSFGTGEASSVLASPI
ncbi:hypothetical protein J6590_018753 [Homalodisca vitripennis]|nr:hypothetical protein J6590_018753 [Homalodisca vitripennis]